MNSWCKIPNNCLVQIKHSHKKRSNQPIARQSLASSVHMNSMPNVDDVLKRLRFVMGVSSDRELSTVFGYSPTAMTNRRSRGSIPYEECVRAAVEKGYSLDWLVLGRGPGPVDSDHPQEPNPVYAAAKREDSDEFVSVPLYDIQGAAGDGRLWQEERIKYFVHFRRDWLAREGLYAKDLVCVEVEGDSMEETLHDRDTVLVNRARLRGDGVYFLRMGEALRIKRLQWLADRSLRLSSDNEIYAPEIIGFENLSQVEILGHCHWRAGRIF